MYNEDVIIAVTTTTTWTRSPNAYITALTIVTN